MNSAPSSYDDLAVPWTDFIPELRLAVQFRIGRRLPRPTCRTVKPSIGRRTFRAFARYSIVFLIGIGATLAWQSYSDEAMEMVRTEAPSLAWLLPVSTAKPPPDDQASATAAVVLLSWCSSLSPGFDLAVVRRSVEQLATMVEQLAAKQDQMAQARPDVHIATLKSVEQEVSQKLSPHLSPGQSPRANPRNPLRSRRPRSHHQCLPRRLLLDNPCADGSAQCTTPATSRGFSFGGE